jgi:hypothetical protein
MKAGVSRKARRPFAALERYADEFVLPLQERAGAIDRDAELTALASADRTVLALVALFAAAQTEWNPSVSMSSGKPVAVGRPAPVSVGPPGAAPAGGQEGTTPSGGPQGETGSAGPTGTSPPAGPEGNTPPAGPAG